MMSLSSNRLNQRSRDETNREEMKEESMREEAVVLSPPVLEEVVDLPVLEEEAAAEDSD